MLMNEIDRVSNHGSEPEDNFEDCIEAKVKCTAGVLRADLSNLSQEELSQTDPVVDLPITHTVSEDMLLLEHLRPPEEVFRFISRGEADFSELSVSKILDQLTITDKQSQDRFTAYFGNKVYRYGQITHAVRDYPQCGVFDLILAKLSKVVPDFSFDNYTCLITYYPNGEAGIPLHADTQQAIEGSMIYTISVGAVRTLQLVNQADSESKHDIKIPHGSVSVFFYLKLFNYYIT